MRGSRLVQWCELFGVAEGTTRVALSRMVERITAAVEAGVADGSLAPVADARGLAEGLYAMWMGGALLAKAHRSVAPFDGCLAQTEVLLAAPKH
jgi:TetR/AcrR family transcriptional repressor of nem operon